ncbi:tRNA (adenosine(37)-N6)-threonylcarbamoyltransferase complex ATPase subunit type 1 TsaE [Candidatus Falkowbacteria bacterium CG10_big_fil_rev_8_21_14_0_10_44_15]|uniref:tRNA threonylcarbamoyladenosine biosynthesis protein TsaE n=1 Tax=Candidatus Falkowbacteria bacterium CG10_big_fil_rev_8_21_14_0_10_44_15 TaxID=1974569 RepID=A0A2H0UZC7_9BACT|nr:MAG: tRNA (adenosine(37)-N6)-threonylcarbamoyltransferase complex ATPase subunit type 1 TsaE [Candidatus Falkowbacteria bacterium CG10_big_fil_rev_8_21_14_0_10_44_15]
MKYLSKSLSDTKKFAVKLARQLRGGEVIGLIGELGSGKTTFTQYLAKALGVKQKVNSPTFNIIKVYKIKNLKIKNFIHIDAYRLHAPKDLAALGAQEYFQNKNAVTVIEWADKVKPILPKNITLIKFRLNKTSRLITIFRH